MKEKDMANKSDYYDEDFRRKIHQLDEAALIKLGFSVKSLEDNEFKVIDSKKDTLYFVIPVSDTIDLSNLANVHAAVHASSASTVASLGTASTGGTVCGTASTLGCALTLGCLGTAE